jgi:GntR family transcriptional regulator
MDISDLQIEEASPVPLWYQLRNAMLSRIISGAWEPGSQLPTEEELCDALGISRSTVRPAVESLVRDGLVVRTRGKGSFVAMAPTTQIKFSPLGFYRTMTARGHTVHSRVLECRRMLATDDLIEELNLHGNEEILLIRRLRFADDHPVVLSSNYLLYDLCAGIEDEDLSTGSLWARLEERLGRKVAGGMHTFHAVLATSEERQLLQIPPDLPLLMSIGTNYLTDGTPFERAIVKVPGDRGLLEVRYITRMVSASQE